MNISFIGAGKVGTAFGKYLISRDVKVSGYYSRSLASAEVAAEYTVTKAYDQLDQMILDSDIIFITTGDDQISDAVNEINHSQGELHLNMKTFCHMSGAHSIKLFEPLMEKGAMCYSLHPLQAFASVEKAADELANTVFSLECKGQPGIMERLLNQMGNGYFTIDSENKSKYHMAACVMSNYLVTLLDQGLSILDSAGVDRDIAIKGFLPLIEGSIKNVVTLGTEQALTGPIARGDGNTVKRHLEAFGSEESEQEAFYKMMGRLTVELAQRAGKLNEEKRQVLSEILE